MTNFKTLILIIAGLILVGCGDSRVAEKEAMREALADEMRGSLSDADRSLGAACVVDTMSAELDNNGWKAVNFMYKDQKEEARAWAEEKNIDIDAISREVGKAVDKAEEVCKVDF